ncbi:MAG: ABC transporter ATP-binding protein [Chloroflexota bacterium]
MTTPWPIELRHVSKAFRVEGRVVEALQDVSLHAEAHEFVSLVGPSGCGKSTLLNLICGLMEPSVGQVLLHGDAQASRLGQTGYMPQHDLLLPWRSVLGNILLGPEARRAGTDGRGGQAALAAARDEALALLPLFGLEGFEHSYPATLSGGMRQRVALMRTFMCKRDVILLDEPFGALDALTRRTMRQWLLDVWQRFRQTALFVTHDVDEALYLSDRIYLLSPRPGRIVDELRVDLPRPRSATICDDPAFARLRQHILAALGV